MPALLLALVDPLVEDVLAPAHPPLPLLPLPTDAKLLAVEDALLEVMLPRRSKTTLSYNTRTPRI
jgi:hypothetical protein